jgi:hypothetical protein
MDYYSPDLPATGAAFGWNADVDRPDWLVDKTMDLGGTLVTERSTGSCSQYGGPQPRLLGEIARERGVRPAPQSLPDPGPKALVDGSL